MTIRSLAQDAAGRISAAIASPLSEQEQTAVTKAVEDAIIEAVKGTMQECRDAALSCATGDQIRKKIVIEINKTASAQFLDMGSMR